MNLLMHLLDTESQCKHPGNVLYFSLIHLFSSAAEGFSHMTYVRLNLVTKLVSITFSDL